MPRATEQHYSVDCDARAARRDGVLVRRASRVARRTINSRPWSKNAAASSRPNSLRGCRLSLAGYVGDPALRVDAVQSQAARLEMERAVRAAAWTALQRFRDEWESMCFLRRPHGTRVTAEAHVW